MEIELKKITSKITDNVIFTGKIPHENIQYYYRVGDIFATASKFETQGLTVIEASASGLASLCILDESYKDSLIENMNGNFFNDEDEYINLVDNLISSPNLLKKYKENATIVANKHSYITFGKEVLKVYEKAIEKRKNH